MKGKCVIGVFSEDDEVAADCIYVFKGYYMFYVIFNVLPWIIFKVIDNSGQSFFLTTRRALKRRMRCAVLIIYPFLLIQIALMLSIYLRMKGIENEKVDCPISESYRSLAMFKIIIVLLHLVLLSWETLWIMKFAIVRATNKCQSR